MEPRIQYAKTSDGVNIAYMTLGEGPPLVVLPTHPYNHLQRLWHLDGWRTSLERLARNRQVVLYDSRGSGLSTRDVPPYTLDALAHDLESVADRVGLEKFAVCSFSWRSSPVAVLFAARHPERVSRMILWCSAARAEEITGPSRVQGLWALMDKDWELFLETAARAYMGWSEPGAPEMVEFLRESVGPAQGRAAMRLLFNFDVADLLPLVQAPTLVLHRREVAYPDVSAAGALASALPNARLVLLEGASALFYLGDVDSALTAIEEFLGEGAAAEPEPQPSTPAAVRTILFTDIEGSTAITQRLGDAKAREVMREHERITRECLRAHGGSEVKTMGDGFMASFGSAVKALECAVAVQKAFAEHSAGGEAIRVRIGLNAGEPIAEEADLFGTAVIAAARIAAQAGGGEILASDVVRQLVAGKGFLFSDRGEVALRGFDDPVRLFEVRWREDT